MSAPKGPRLRVGNVHELPWLRTREQQNADGSRSAVLNRIVASEPMFVSYTRYEPGMMLARHSHRADEVIFILEGEVRVGEQLWTEGTVAILEEGAFFGPLVAGPKGALLFEVFNGRPERAGQDRSGWQELHAAQGVTELPIPGFALPEDAI
jgi:ChrR Cupin-like domain